MGAWQEVRRRARAVSDTVLERAAGPQRRKLGGWQRYWHWQHQLRTDTASSRKPSQGPRERWMLPPLFSQRTLGNSLHGSHHTMLWLPTCHSLLTWLGTHGEQMSSSPGCPQGLAWGLTGSSRTVNDEWIRSISQSPYGQWRPPGPSLHDGASLCHRRLLHAAAVPPQFAHLEPTVRRRWNSPSLALKEELWHLFEQRFPIIYRSTIFPSVFINIFKHFCPGQLF